MRSRSGVITERLGRTRRWLAARAPRPSWRALLAVASLLLVVAALAVFVSAGVAALVFSGMALLLAATGSRPLAPRPKLHVTVLIDDHEPSSPLVIEVAQFETIRQAIADDERARVEATIPAPPPTAFLAISMPDQLYDQGLSDLDRKWDKYEDELHRWLDAHHQRCWPYAVGRRMSARIENAGVTAAADVVFTLELPRSVQNPEEPAPLDPPPERPVYRRPVLFGPHITPLRLPMTRITPLNLIPKNGFRAFDDRDRLVARCALGTVMPGVERLDDHLFVLPDDYGSYDVIWRLTGSNFPALEGTLQVEVRPLPDGDAVTSLDELQRVTHVPITPP
jgi:hypothetical protein